LFLLNFGLIFKSRFLWLRSCNFLCFLFWRVDLFNLFGLLVLLFSRSGSNNLFFFFLLNSYYFGFLSFAFFLFYSGRGFWFSLLFFCLRLFASRAWGILFRLLRDDNLIARSILVGLILHDDIFLKLILFVVVHMG